MPKLMLADIVDGMPVRTLAYLKQKKLQTYRNKPGAFLILTLSDKSGTLEGKVFENAEEVARGIDAGTVVSIAGRASTYQNVLGLVLDSAEAWDGPVDQAEFMPAYDGDPADLEAKLDALIASLTDPDLSRLINSILNDPEIRERYCTAPAAKGMHSAYLHGLLEHVVRQAQVAETVCHTYPSVNRDLVIAGVLLHDIGKIIEFDWEMSIDYSTIGRLHGHAVIGDRLINERARELGIAEETALHLSHLILSHHGTREFGAVVVPQTLEAVILHAVDNLEAKVAHCLEAMKNGDQAAAWTEYDRVEARHWYRGAAPYAEALPEHE